MFRNRPALPSRKLIAWIAGITFIPLAALSLLGWRLLDMDRTQENQRAQERVEQSARLVAAELQRAVSSSRQELAAGSENWPEGAVAVTFRDNRIEAHPKDRVLFLPETPQLREPPSALFVAGKEMEYQKHDFTGAIQSFRELTKSPDPAVRAGALLRMGRNLANNGRVEEALAAYVDLSHIDDVAIAGTPASLAGLYLRCVLFEREKRTAELQTEAKALERHLNVPRWLLTEAIYKVYAGDIARWLGSNAEPPRDQVFEAAIEEVWKRRRSLSASGQMTLSDGDETFAVLWLTAGDSVRALIAAPKFVASQWERPARVLAAEQNVSFQLGEPLVDGGSPPVILKSSETALPWDVVTRSETAGPGDAFLFRRRLLIAGFVLLTLMTVTASYLIYRAIGRELEVARLQSDFVAAVSHEFRTPLTSLRQFTSRLRENPNLSEEGRSVCYDAQMRAADRLVGLVESLLDFGRMEAGARRYHFEPRDCTEIVRRAVDEFRNDPQAANHAIAIRGDDPITADTDADALSRAVRNLLENAVKYSPDDRNIEVALSRSNGHVRIAVRDRGIGIPAEERARVFRKFQRGEQARTRGIKGTGIGLAMVDEIVKAHHGRVELESEPGAGSTFTLVLPAKD